MNRRPLVAPHWSTGTYTSLVGRKLSGRTNASLFDPLDCEIAPRNVTIPFDRMTCAFRVPNGLFVHSLIRCSFVYDVVEACAPGAIATVTGSNTATERITRANHDRTLAMTSASPHSQIGSD